MVKKGKEGARILIVIRCTCSTSIDALKYRSSPWIYTNTDVADSFAAQPPLSKFVQIFTDIKRATGVTSSFCAASGTRRSAYTSEK